MGGGERLAKIRGEQLHSPTTNIFAAQSRWPEDDGNQFFKKSRPG